MANTRKGRQVLNVDPPDIVRVLVPVEGELVASVGENRKLLVFPLDQIPEITESGPRGPAAAVQRRAAVGF